MGEFTQVTRRGWEAVATLAGDETATRLFAFLADQCGHDNALVCTYELLSEELGISERTIRRAVRRLEDLGYVVVLRVGSALCYVLDPDLVWKTAEQFKRYCAFRTRTLVPFSDNPTFRKRLTMAGVVERPAREHSNAEG